MKHRSLVWLAVATLVLAACGSSASPTSAPRDTAPRPQVGTPTPTSGPVARPATPTPSPTAAPTTAAAVDKYGGTLRVAVARGDEPWDIMVMPRGGVAARQMAPVAFSQLAVVPNSPGTGCSLVHQLQAAESWRWKDSQTLEVKVREGIRFQNKPPVNGREMTAQDVAFSLGRLKAKQSRIAGVTQLISGIEVLDKYGVRITLSRPYPPLPEEFLGTPFGGLLLAKESGDFASDAHWGSWADPAKSHVGSGPFSFVRELPAVKVTYVRNPDYWKKGMPFVDGIEYHVMPEWSTQVAALAGGKIDGWPSQTPFDVYLNIKKTLPQMNVSEGCVLWGSPVIYMNTQRPPFNDARVRRAAAMAIDKKGLMGLLQGQAVLSAAMPPTQPFFPKTEDYPSDLRRYLEYHTDEAKKLLAEAGFPQGLDTTMNTAPAALPRLWMVYAEAVLPYLEAAGIRAKMKVYERGAWDAVANKGQYDGLAMVTGAAAHEPWLWLGTFHSKNDPSMNRSLVVDRQMDTLVEDLQVTLDQAKRESLAKQIQARIAEQAYWIYLPAPVDWAVSQPYVKDFGPMPFFPFSNTWAEVTWIDKTVRR